MAVLPDLLKPGLKVVFCGTAAGAKSAKVGAYYAGPGNQFWSVLHRIGLTPRRLAPQEFQELLSFGIGLTDLWKEASGSDSEVAVTDPDVQSLRSRVLTYSPRVLAFNGKSSAMAFLGRATSYGRQMETIGRTDVFVLPSTSGAARGYWNESYWRDLAKRVQRTSGGVRKMNPPKSISTTSRDRLTEKGRRTDREIKKWFAMTGADVAKPRELMTYLVKQEVFSKDHREGLPLRTLLRRLEDAGQLSVITTARFDQMPKNKSWYFVRPGTTARPKQH